MGFWSQFFVPLGTHTCAFEYTYLCLLGVKTCSGPFLSFSKPQSVLGKKVCFKVWFWRFSKKTSFWTILLPVGVSKRHFGAFRLSFLGDSGDPNMHKNDQKGLLRCRKAQNNFQNTLGVLRKPFPNFRKIVEFATFRQHWLGQKGFFKTFSWFEWPKIHPKSGKKVNFYVSSERTCMNNGRK